nr:MAG: RNA-dependent RNA polymerase [Riboviria sp.]
MCVLHRIEQPRNPKRLNHYYRGLSKEYIKRIAKAVGVVMPISHEEVLRLMPRKERAAKIEKNLHNLAHTAMRPMRTFQKPETYSGIKAPRNISPVPDEQLLEMSRFLYPFVAALKKADLGWYAPGMDPHSMSTQVARVTRSGKYFGADYSGFDGHQNRDLRRIVRDIVTLCLPEEYRAEWIERFEMEVTAKATTSFGVVYEALGSMLSGSAITTVGNTLLNGFFYFVAAARSGIPLDHVLSYMRHSCILYGDDSAGPERIKHYFMQTCAQLGIVVTEEDCSDGLVFLGRLYFEDGSIYSIFDPMRIMTKIHVTTAARNVPTDVAACNRAHGIKASCKGETWVECICNAILRRWGNLAEDASFFNSEELFRYDERGCVGLPECLLPVALPLVEKRLGLEAGMMTAIMMDYDAGLYPSGWIDNGCHSNKFSEDVYITDPLNSSLFQVRYPPGYGGGSAEINRP